MLGSNVDDEGRIHTLAEDSTYLVGTARLDRFALLRAHFHLHYLAGRPANVQLADHSLGNCMGTLSKIDSKLSE